MGSGKYGCHEQRCVHCGNCAIKLAGIGTLCLDPKCEGVNFSYREWAELLTNETKN
jgi:hypothetical protein